MAARKHPKIPRVSVLQLDTHFPRIPGDIGCLETFNTAPEILRVPGALVESIVTDTPQDIKVDLFEEFLRKATGDIITTSCGFLSYWQNTLLSVTDRPFISSSLTALPRLARHYTPQELMILTFDSTLLNIAHLNGAADYKESIVGLPPDCHLRSVITNDLPELDFGLAQEQMCNLVVENRSPKTRAILLECTNLPPYKTMLQSRTNLPVYDILTCLEHAKPGSIQSRFSGSKFPP